MVAIDDFTQLIQALFGAVTTGFTVWLGARAFGRRTGVVAGIAYALYPGDLVASGNSTTKIDAAASELSKKIAKLIREITVAAREAGGASRDSAAIRSVRIELSTLALRAA